MRAVVPHAHVGRVTGVLALAAVFVCGHKALAATSLVADLSSGEIAITAGFSGTELLLFGAVEGSGDVVVVVRGPKRRELVRRKNRVAGIWVNGRTVAFDGTPAYYRVAATTTLDKIASSRTLKRLRIGTENLQFTAAASEGPVEQFRTALLRNKKKNRLYGANVGKVTIVSGRLFRTSVRFPPNVPTGTYKVDVYMFRKGKVIGRFERPLTVHKAGIEADIFNFAHRNAVWYGIFAIIIALVAGWVAGAIFRKA